MPRTSATRRRRRGTYRFGLEFLSPNVGKGHLPGSPHVRLYLRVESTHRGRISLTDDCVSLRELDDQISILRDELRILRAEARHKFKRHRDAEERQRNWRERRH